MKFWEAMKLLDEGKAARRNDWNRVAYVQKFLTTFNLDVPYTTAQMSMVMKSGRVGPYTPSNCDMLGDDWTELQFMNKEG